MELLLQFNTYLLYGLVFFAIGWVILSRNIRFSRLAVASALPALAWFGFTHGFHEWSELYLLIYGDGYSQQTWHWIQHLRLAKLLISFVALIVFAWQMFNILATPQRRWLTLLMPTLVSVYVVASAVHWWLLPMNDYLDLSVVLTRAMFGFIGASLAGAALILYGRDLRKQRHRGATAFEQAGIAFIGYAFAAGALPTEWGLWVPMTRTLTAGLFLFWLMQALKIFDLEFQQQIEQQQKQLLRTEKLRAIGELASGIAHEIKTPLSYATIGCDLLELNQDNPQQVNKQLERIRDGLHRANHISQAVLNFARPSDGSHKRIDLNRCVDNALRLMQHQLKPYQINRNQQPQLPLLGDAIAIEEVIINLITNSIGAIKARGAKNGANKSIELTSWQDDSRVYLQVSDHGGGMPQAILEQAFTPFFTTKPAGEGTGLGLAICQQIVQQHYGEISLENHHDGLTVLLTFPRS